VIFLTAVNRKDGNDADLVLADLECVQLQVFELFQIVHEVEELLVADDVYTFRKVHSDIAEHQTQASTDGLLWQDVCFGCIGSQANNNRDVLNVPPLTQHQNTDNGIDGTLRQV